jgi:hypothetical protein
MKYMGNWFGKDTQDDYNLAETLKSITEASANLEQIYTQKDQITPQPRQRQAPKNTQAQARQAPKNTQAQARQAPKNTQAQSRQAPKNTQAQARQAPKNTQAQSRQAPKNTQAQSRQRQQQEEDLQPPVKRDRKGPKRSKRKRKQYGGDVIPVYPVDQVEHFDPSNACENMDRLNEKGLLNLQKINNNYKTATGLDPTKRQEICAAMHEHWQERTALIERIKGSLAFCNDRINSFNGDGFCSNNDPLYTKSVCNNDRYEWYHVDNVISSNKEINARINRMKYRYNNNLQKLKGVLDTLKKTERLDSYDMAALKRSTEQLIKNMHKTCNNYYIPITMEIMASSAAARLDALRISRGLQDYIENPKPQY